MRNSFLIVVVLLGLMAVLLGSCKTYQSITKKPELTIEELQAQIVPEKDYILIFKTGMELYVHVTQVDSLKVYGEAQSSKDTPSFTFVDTYESIQRNVNKVLIWKYNGTLTTWFVVISTVCIIWVLDSNSDWPDYSNFNTKTQPCYPNCP